MRLNNRVKWTDNQILPTFDATVTVLHKTKNATTKLDEWSKTVYNNCYFGQKNERSVSGQTVSIGAYFVCRIPKQSTFACDVGDYVVKGTVTETPTPSNILTIYQTYKSNAFMVKTFSNNTSVIEVGEHYHLEGI